MKKSAFISTLCVAMTLWVTNSHAVLLSTFDTDTENWTAIGGASGFTWLPTGGNPDGRLNATDGSGLSVWYFSSPDSWDGDWSGYIGETLSFDLLVESIIPSGTDDDIRIYSGTSYLSWVAPNNPTIDIWETFSVQLLSGSFSVNGTKTFSEILADVTELRILGDYGGLEISSLDNVSVGAAVVPIPAAIWLFGSGLLGLIGISRRKKSA